jgi:hypothetical protein
MLSDMVHKNNHKIIRNILAFTQKVRVQSSAGHGQKNEMAIVTKKVKLTIIL